MKAHVELNEYDMVTVIQSHAVKLLRVDFEPKDVTIFVKPKGEKEWCLGQVKATISVTGDSENFVE